MGVTTARFLTWQAALVLVVSELRTYLPPQAIIERLLHDKKFSVEADSSPSRPVMHGLQIPHRATFDVEPPTGTPEP